MHWSDLEGGISMTTANHACCSYFACRQVNQLTSSLAFPHCRDPRSPHGRARQPSKLQVRKMPAADSRSDEDLRREVDTTRIELVCGDGRSNSSSLRVVGRGTDRAQGRNGSLASFPSFTSVLASHGITPEMPTYLHANVDWYVIDYPPLKCIDDLLAKGDPVRRPLSFNTAFRGRGRHTRGRERARTDGGPSDRTEASPLPGGQSIGVSPAAL